MPQKHLPWRVHPNPFPPLKNMPSLIVGLVVCPFAPQVYIVMAFPVFERSVQLVGVVDLMRQLSECWQVFCESLEEAKALNEAQHVLWRMDVGGSSTRRGPHAAGSCT